MVLELELVLLVIVGIQTRLQLMRKMIVKSLIGLHVVVVDGGGGGENMQTN